MGRNGRPVLSPNLILVLLFMVSWSGCVDQEPEATHIVVKRFTSTYLFSGTHELTVSLGEPAVILSQEGDWVEALPLVRASLADPRDVDIYWLDADLRAVRVDDQCDRKKEDGCETASVEWGQAGLPPYPILDVFSAKETHLDVPSPHGAVRVPYVTEVQDGQKVVDLEVRRLTGIREYMPSRVEFEPGEPAPLRIEMDPALWEPYLIQRLSYTETGDVKFPPPSNPTPPEYQAYTGQGTYFPGADQDALGMGYTHRELIEGLSNEHSEVAAAAAAGCLRRYQVGPNTDPDPLWGADDVVFGDRVGTVEIAYAGPNEQPREWKADVYTTPEGPRFELKSVRELPGSPGCEPARRYWPMVDAGAFLEQARPLIDERHPIRYFTYRVSPPSWLPGLTMENATHVYQAFFTPDWTMDHATVGFKPLRVTMDADSGRLVDLVVEGSDYQAVDERSS